MLSKNKYNHKHITLFLMLYTILFCMILFFPPVSDPELPADYGTKLRICILARCHL